MVEEQMQEITYINLDAVLINYLYNHDSITIKKLKQLNETINSFFPNLSIEVYTANIIYTIATTSKLLEWRDDNMLYKLRSITEKELENYSFDLPEEVLNIIRNC